MNKTKIPWADYTINPVKGLCPMACDYCYARRMYKRFKWNPEIRFESGAMDDLLNIPSGAKVFWGSTMELFGDWVKPEQREFIFKWCASFPELTHIFLTKQPQNLKAHSPFPDNCWILVSATDQPQYLTGLRYLRDIDAVIRGFSFEPLLHKINASYDTLDWVIIGSQTQPTRHPPMEWADDIINSANEFKTPVFVKEPLASYISIQRREFPPLEVPKLSGIDGHRVEHE